MKNTSLPLLRPPDGDLPVQLDWCAVLWKLPPELFVPPRSLNYFYENFGTNQVPFFKGKEAKPPSFSLESCPWKNRTKLKQQVVIAALSCHGHCEPMMPAPQHLPMPADIADTPRHLPTPPDISRPFGCLPSPSDAYGPLQKPADPLWPLVHPADPSTSLLLMSVYVIHNLQVHST